MPAADVHAFAALLAEARTHGRAVVVTADHGHVLAQPHDGGTGGGSGGERWRNADRPAGPTEVQLRGKRVRRGGDAGILAPWDGDFRYLAKAGGYHGGATPEEVLVPVAVLLPAGLAPPPGWDVWSEAPPLWWGLRLDAAAATPPPSPRPRTRRSPTANGPSWLTALLASPTWRQQVNAAGRAALAEDRTKLVLTAIVRRGGVASYAAIASDAVIRLPRGARFLANLARVLNVDGYAVLDLDPSGQEARLSRLLLAQQFEIEIA